MVEKVLRKTGGAEKEADALRKRVLSADNGLNPKGHTYYVSQNGNDDNDGLSPENAFKSPDAIADLLLDAGDAVLFERGSIFRMEETFWMKGGVSYGAYGKGNKPAFYGSLKDYADPSLWKKVNDKDIWYTEIKTEGIKRAACITFNDDTYVGVWQIDIDGLEKDGDYTHDTDKGIFYLYFEGGNPGEYFYNIEISTTDTAFLVKNAKDINIDNITLKYFTRTGFLFGECDGISVTNCVVDWLGGAVYQYDETRYPSRFGNAFETWYRSEDVIVKNCWFNQIFDAAVTFQGSGDGLACFDNIIFEDNLIEYCSMNIEYWVGTGAGADQAHIRDILYKGNIVRMSGYGWGGLQRCNKENQCSLLGCNRKYEDLENFVISDCVLDCADGCMIYMWGPKEQKGITLKNNTYYQIKTSGTHPWVQTVRGYPNESNNQEEFEAAIALFDEHPKLVKWLD